MKPLKIYIDSNYPKPLVDILISISNLQKERNYEVIRWGEVKDDEIRLENSIFLVVDYNKRGLTIPIVKQAEDGYRTIVYKVTEEKPDRFEHMMTVLRVWPFIFEKHHILNTSTLLTFKYGGRRLLPYSKNI